MKDITISSELLQVAIEKAMPEIIKDKLSSSYSSPLAKVIEEEFSKQDGFFRTLIAETISKAVNDEEFKKRLGEKVLEKIIEKGLK